MQRKLVFATLTAVALAYSGAASAQIKIGVAGPLSGSNAAFGAQLRNGVDQAVEDINAAARYPAASSRCWRSPAH